MQMWYVMQVRTGSERSIQQQCRIQIPENVLEKCFVPEYEVKRRVQGVWKIEKKLLFPGYVFAVTEELEKLQEYLREVIGLTRLIGAGNEVVALTESEVEFLMRFGGTEQVVRMSEGIIENSKIMVQSGPLKGMEGFIRKIDRHKRKAWLELELFGRVQRVEVGLEIFAKL